MQILITCEHNIFYGAGEILDNRFVDHANCSY